MFAERAEIATHAAQLAPRAWAIDRIDAWLRDPAGVPVMLVGGPPGSGKSSLLLQYLARAGQAGDSAPFQVAGTVLRHPRLEEPFDVGNFLGGLLETLSKYAESTDRRDLPVSIPQLKVEAKQNIGHAENVTAVAITGVELSTMLSGLVPLVRQRVQAIPSQLRVLIVVDALDQAEDEQAKDFLEALSTLVKAARGTGVRFLCSSRGASSIWLDPERCTTLNLYDDADNLDGELRAFLQNRFGTVAPDDRQRLVEALVGGAQGNWLWASTNAAALEDEIARSGTVPAQIALGEGLTGLYRDGLRRIQQRAGTSKWEQKVRPLLGAVACAFGGGMGPIELRWVTGLEAADIDDLVDQCRPFVEPGHGGQVHLFHPDFGRWLLGGNVTGLSEKTQHLTIAAGLTRLGKTMGWNDVTASYAAPWVLHHWCSLLILDPFHPNAEHHEQQVIAVLGDDRWSDRAGAVTDTIEQAGMVAPRLHLPGHPVPLSLGLRALRAAESVNTHVGILLTFALPPSDAVTYAALSDGQAAQAFIEERLPGYQAVVSRAIWGGLLRGYYTISGGDEGLEITIAPRCVLDTLRSPPYPEAQLHEAAIALCRNVSEQALPELIDALQDALSGAGSEGPRKRTEAEATDLAVSLDRQPRTSLTWQATQSCLGEAYQLRARTHSEADEAAATEDLRRAVACFVAAWQATAPGDPRRVDRAIDVANTAFLLPERSDDELELLIAAQTEIHDRRQHDADPRWPLAANLLGDAYRARADSRPEGDPLRPANLQTALDAYTNAWQATPADDPRRLTYAIDLANTLRIALPERSDDELELLIAAQTEIRDARHVSGSEEWPLSANLLGDAYRARARRSLDPPGHARDLRAALAAYVEAWRAVPLDHENRLIYAIDVADTIFSIPERSGEELELLVASQTEIRDARRERDDPQWPRAAKLLGDALHDRADSRSEPPAKIADLQEALNAYVQAWRAAAEHTDDRSQFATNVLRTLLDLPEHTAGRATLLEEVQTEIRDLLTSHVAQWRRTPPDDTRRLDRAIQVANTLLALPDRSGEEHELLVAVQREIRDTRHAAGDDQWPMSANLLGDAYRGRGWSRPQEDDEGRLADLRAALASYVEGWQASPEDHEQRLTFPIDVANAIRDLPEPTADERAMLVDAQAEIRDLRRAANDPDWPLSAKLLGDAYVARAKHRSEADLGRTADLRAALDAYCEAWLATPPGREQRLNCAIGVANSVRDLPEPTGDELTILVAAQTEIRDLRRATNDPDWPLSANLLGDAYLARANRRSEEDLGRTADLRAALDAYGQAWAATPADGSHRLGFAVDMVNALFALPRLSGIQLTLLIEVLTEICDAYRATGDPDWPATTNTLGDAFRARADEEAGTRTADLRAALDAYVQAWRATPVDGALRLAYTIDVANTLFALPRRAKDDLDLLVDVQAEVRDIRRAAEDWEWSQAANLLGDAYRDRAEARSDDMARMADMAEAVSAYDEALRVAPPDHPRRLDFAIDAANTRLVYAVIAHQDGQRALDEALAIISSEATRRPEDFAMLQRLLPVLGAQSRRQPWWSHLEAHRVRR